MKKPVVVLIILFSIAAIIGALVLFLPFPGWPAQMRAIEEINRNCDVPFGLAMPETELKNTDGYVREEGFGGYRLKNDDIMFGLSGYPDVLNDYHIVSYEIKSPKYTFMGLRVGCSLDAARKVMEQNGFALDDSFYKKSGVGITIYSNKYTVTSFYVLVYTSNTKGVVF